MMNETGAPFSIYPYGYEEKLAEKRASQEYEERRQPQLADDLSVDLEVIAIAALTGIAGREHKDTMLALPTPEQARKLGRTPVRHLISVDNPLFLSLLDNEQPAVINEHTVLGHATPHAA